MLNLLIICLFVVFASYFPGRIIVENFKLTIEEKFVCSFGISFLVYYFIGFTGYILGINNQLVYPLFILAFSLIYLYFQFKKKFIKKEELAYLGLYLVVFLIIVSYQGLIPFYAGADWYFDWFEHYERVLFFLERLPLLGKFGPYLLTARPPLFNVTAYFYQSILGRQFWVFQILATFFNLSMMLSGFLILRLLKPKKKLITLFIVTASVFLLNPSFIIQTTFTWTKGLASYYVLTGLYFYFKSISYEKRYNPYFSFIFLAAAQLTHYSAVIFIMGVFVDLSIKTLTKGKSYLKAFLLPIGLYFLIIFSWYGWAIYHYGFNETVFGNTTFAWQTEMTFDQRLTKDLNNVKNTLLPVSSIEYYQKIQKSNPLLALSELGYAVYATTLVGQTTLVLSTVLLFYFLVKFRRLFSLVSSSFVTVFLTSLFLAVITIPSKNLLGFAHVTLIPFGILLVIAAIYILVSLVRKIPKVVLGIIIAFMGLEALIGIGLRLYVLRYEQNLKYLFEQGKITEMEAVLPEYKLNFFLKNNNNLVFLADHENEFKKIFFLLLIIGEVASIGSLTYIFLFMPLKEKAGSHRQRSST